MGTVNAVINEKGGVGKTAIPTSLAYNLVQKCKKDSIE
ncbi:MAG: AAA family ATPase [Clostridia bacterium]|nr:AAA family ATPase [Clostridia bacterium]